MIEITFVPLFISMVLPGPCLGFVQSMRFELSSGDTSANGLICAVTKYETARGVEFETSTETCSALDITWFSTQLTVPGNTYFKLLSVERRFEETSALHTILPKNFHHGDSVVISFEKEAVSSGAYRVTLVIDLFDGDAVVGRFGYTDHMYFHMSNYKYSGLLMFNSYVNGGWQQEQYITDPFIERNAKLQLTIQQNTILVFAGDVIVYNYTTAIAVSDRLLLVSYGIDTLITTRKILYLNDL